MTGTPICWVPSRRMREPGELAKRVSPETLATMLAVDWRAAKALREVLVHDRERREAKDCSRVRRPDRR